MMSEELLRILDEARSLLQEEMHKQAAQERLDDGGVRQVNIGHILRTKRPHKHRKKAARATRMAKEVGQIYLHQTQVRQAALRALRHRFRRFHHINIEVLGRPLGYRFELQDNAVVSYWPTGATGRPTAAVPMPQHFVPEVRLPLSGPRQSLRNGSPRLAAQQRV